MYQLAKCTVAQGMGRGTTTSVRRCAIDMCTDALTTATSTLRLLPTSDEQYILDTVTEQQQQVGGGGNGGGGGGGAGHTKLVPVWIEDLQCRVMHNRCRLALLERYEREREQESERAREREREGAREGARISRGSSAPLMSSSLLLDVSRKRSRQDEEREGQQHSLRGRTTTGSTQQDSLFFGRNKERRKQGEGQREGERGERVEPPPDLLASPRDMTLVMMSFQVPTLVEFELCVETAVVHTMDQHRPKEMITPTNDIRLQWLRPIVEKMSQCIILFRLNNTKKNKSNRDERRRKRNNKDDQIQLNNLLRSVLTRLDGVESNHELHRLAADAMLSIDSAVGLPMWLIQSLVGGVGSLRFGRPLPRDKSSTVCYMPRTTYLPSFANGGGHPTALVEVYVKHGRLADACDVASSVIANMNGIILLETLYRDETDATVPGAIVPHHVLDMLLARCDHVLKCVLFLSFSLCFLFSLYVSFSSADSFFFSFSFFFPFFFFFFSFFFPFYYRVANSFGRDTEEVEPDRRVVQKLKSSMDYLKASLLQYFEGRLQADEDYAIKSMLQKSSWELSSFDFAATQ